MKETPDIRYQSDAAATGATPIRRHDAFLDGYAPEDEGLYDLGKAPIARMPSSEMRNTSVDMG
jgi:hypothetical protein